ncbi:MAG: tRNA lysidine(34) synthetase TilS [Chloroflexi bacterium]|nr:tRNA lysidine(34) synthetase TilS [Chloroflexota bacterium]
MLKTFKNILKEHNVQKQSVVAAVSGGADSLCLLLMLNQVKKELDLHITCTHFNHNLRGTESKQDQIFVNELCQKFNIDFITIDWQQPKSSEDECRKARYDFLYQVAKQQNQAIVMTGHTQSDLAETFLLNLARGSGAQGLCSLNILSPMLQAKEITLLRPLLKFSAQDTRAYCVAQGIEARYDSSNNNLAYKRNLIRQQILPLLKDINPRVEEAIAQSAAIIHGHNSCIRQQAQKMADKLFNEKNSSYLEIAKEAFLSLPVPIAKEVAREALKRLLGSLKDIESKHIDLIIEATAKKNGSALSLPQNWQMLVSYDKFIFCLQKDDPPPLQATTIGMGEQVLFGQYVFTLQKTEQVPLKLDINHDIFWLENGQRLSIRPPHEGDRLLITTGSKKVSDILGEAKIERRQRMLIPLVTQDDIPLWLCGIQKSYKKYKKHNGQMAILSLAPKNN